MTNDKGGEYELLVPEEESYHSQGGPAPRHTNEESPKEHTSSSRRCNKKIPRWLKYTVLVGFVVYLLLVVLLQSLSIRWVDIVVGGERLHVDCQGEISQQFLPDLGCTLNCWTADGCFYECECDGKLVMSTLLCTSDEELEEHPTFVSTYLDLWKCREHLEFKSWN